MIRKATTGDFDFVYSLCMHPQINRFMFYDPMPANDFKPIFDDFLRRDVLYIYETAKQVPVGMFKLARSSHRASHVASLGGVAIHPEFGGKGHGAQMLSEIISMGREQKVVRMELGVSVINTKAIHLYEKAGFVREGILSKYIYLKNEDRYLDDVLMAYIYD